MKRYAFLATVFATVLILVLPFAGGGGPGLMSPIISDSASAQPVLGSAAPVPQVQPAAAVPLAKTFRVNDAAAIAQTQEVLAKEQEALTKDWEHLPQKPVPKPLPPVSESGAASGTNERRAALEAAGQSCPGYSSGSTSGAPSAVSALGVAGTTSDDLASFAAQQLTQRAAARVNEYGSSIPPWVIANAMHAPPTPESGR